MFRRFFVVFTVVIILAGMLVFPVYAAESYTFNFVWSDDMGAFVSQDQHVLSEGITYNFDVYLSWPGNEWDSPIDNQYVSSCIGELVDDDGALAIALVDENVIFIQANIDGGLFTALVLSNVNDTTFTYRVVVTPQEKDYYNDTLVNTFNSVISWVGSVVSSLISGPLSPLLLILAVGIAVAALFVAIKIICAIIWGA